MSTSTTHNSSVTCVASSVTVTATINFKEKKGSKFDIGSFVGGVGLPQGILSFLHWMENVLFKKRHSVKNHS